MRLAGEEPRDLGHERVDVGAEHEVVGARQVDELGIRESRRRRAATTSGARVLFFGRRSTSVGTHTRLWSIGCARSWAKFASTIRSAVRGLAPSLPARSSHAEEVAVVHAAEERQREQLVALARGDPPHRLPELVVPLVARGARRRHRAQQHQLVERVGEPDREAARRRRTTSQANTTGFVNPAASITVARSSLHWSTSGRSQSTIGSESPMPRRSKIAVRPMALRPSSRRAPIGSSGQHLDREVEPVDHDQLERLGAVEHAVRDVRVAVALRIPDLAHEPSVWQGRRAVSGTAFRRRGSAASPGGRSRSRRARRRPRSRGGTARRTPPGWCRTRCRRPARRAVTRPLRRLRRSCASRRAGCAGARARP